jgi:hypothetical protein
MTARRSEPKEDPKRNQSNLKRRTSKQLKPRGKGRRRQREGMKKA